MQALSLTQTFVRCLCYGVNMYTYVVLNLLLCLSFLIPYFYSNAIFQWFWLPYSRDQKHVLLFRKSKILQLKSQLLDNMPHIFLRTKLFCLSRQKADFQQLYDWRFCETSQNFRSFVQFLLILGHVTNWIQMQLVTWGVTIQDVLLLATIW